LIDRLRHDIEQRLEQLLAEAEKLRSALAALNPGSRPAPLAAVRPTTKAASPPSATRSARPQARLARTPTGATKTAVLGALAHGGAMTAGDVAAATGLARPTVSTTLSKLAQAGEVLKAKRGYRLLDPAAPSTAPAAAESGK
jgi:DNA-binding transcriptional ArsR family regulator